VLSKNTIGLIFDNDPSVLGSGVEQVINRLIVGRWPSALVKKNVQRIIMHYRLNF